MSHQVGTVESRREATGERDEREALLAGGTTPRAVLIGAVLSVLLCFLAVCQQALGGGLSADGAGTGALFLLFALICGTRLLKRVGALRSGLRPQELMVVFSMLLVASVVPINGALIYLLPHMAGFTHYATPENEWGSRVAPLLPGGLVISDPAVAKGFFEGLGQGAAVPYSAWVKPLCAWAVFLGVLYLTMISLMVILRKRWMEQERLSFPLAQLPLSLAGEQGGERLQNRVFWVGFCTAALVGLSGILRQFLPFIPSLQPSFGIRIYRNSIPLGFETDFIVLGISYLVSMEILGSILLFTILSYVQICLLIASASAILGVSPYIPYAHYTQLHQESLGALAVLVVVGVYEARHHLKDVFGKALGSARAVDDGDEMLSYRAAVVGSMTGVAFICYWLVLTGISPWVVPLFVGLMLVTFLGVTRVLAETGVIMQAPLSPMQSLLQSAGTQALGGSTVAGFFVAQPWAFPGTHYGLSNGPHAMASASTALRLTHRAGLRSRALAYACFLALLVGGITGAVALLHYAYTLGAYGFANSFYVIKILNYHLSYYGEAIKSHGEGGLVHLLWSGAGAVVMVLLTLVRQRFFWWPIQPIGFAVGTVVPVTWFSIFTAWVIKRNVLKYGGPSLYGRTRPFFLGLILGQAVIVSIGSLVTMLTGRV